ncbi:TetR/AcrR family transcriptional regulator [Microbacterium sp. KUDC0406]|uniref:TetR/AcrR family transcriptional regulator n=1 Tax=Microbacterium sp. KUDC0406 TaxID=2909588 RepID=UPI001F406AEF|nr:TetR/AcrR family transcriptional regulator [Microbacterium sp. KUDC0406]UJP09395.1 TetR/AcrR family transcriptional regulator [Microbacterium sp. KUDC0406]
MARPRSEKARQSVLAAMRRALTESGYSDITIEGLALEAGVSKQTIYRWWPSKAAILGEALLEGEMLAFDLPVTSDLRADLRAVLSAQSPDAVSLARALIEVTATDVELGLKLNARLAAPLREWTLMRLAQAVDAGDVRADVDAAGRGRSAHCDRLVLGAGRRADGCWAGGRDGRCDSAGDRGLSRTQRGSGE